MRFVNQNKWFYKRFVIKSQKIKLGLKNLYIFPSLFGLYWILTAITIYILGVNLENKFTVFICYLMITVMVISLFLTHFNIHGLELFSTEQEINFANSKLNYKFIISSKKYRNNIKIKFLNKESKFIHIQAIEGKKVNYIDIEKKKRGIHKPDIIYGESSAPFSLFNCWFYWQPIDYLIIAPEPIRGKSYYQYIQGNELRKSSNVKDQLGEELQDLKPYKKGDKKSLIYWKSLARSNNILTKNLSKQISNDNWLVLNKKLPLEKALENLCFDVKANYKANNFYGIKLSKHEYINPGAGEKHYVKILFFLAEYKK